MSTIERRVWVRENAYGLPEQSALWESRVKPNTEQANLGHRVVPYTPDPQVQKADGVTGNDLAVALDKAAALDLLEQWLDVHPVREVDQLRKRNGKYSISIWAGAGECYTSTTQETLASAIRTVLQIAISNGDK